MFFWEAKFLRTSVNLFCGDFVHQLHQYTKSQNIAPTKRSFRSLPMSADSPTLPQRYDLTCIQSHQLLVANSRYQLIHGRI